MRRRRLLAWLILAALANGFPEIVAGSDLFPYFHPWGLLVELPLYGLHLLVLAAVVFRFGRPRLSVLWTAGTLVGLYEAYVTKVLWNPTWGPPMFRVGGVAAFESVVLVFFWHAWLAFVVPLLAGELILLGRPGACWRGLPPGLARLLRTPRRAAVAVGAVAVACGAFQSFNSPTVAKSLLSGAGFGAGVAALAWWWRRGGSPAAGGLAGLLPAGRSFRIAAILLGALYFVLGVGMRREALPGLGPQATIWGVYAVLIGLFVRLLRRSRGRPLPSSPAAPRFGWRGLAGFFALFTAVSAGLNALPGRHEVVNLAYAAVLSIGSSVAMFVLAGREAFTRAARGPRRGTG